MKKSRIINKLITLLNQSAMEKNSFSRISKELESLKEAEKITAVGKGWFGGFISSNYMDNKINLSEFIKINSLLDELYKNN